MRTNHGTGLAVACMLTREQLTSASVCPLVYIARYAFDEQCLQGKHMFKLRQAQLYKVFLSEELKRKVKDEGLQGQSYGRAANKFQVGRKQDARLADSIQPI